MGVEETSPNWAVRVEMNAAGTFATVTAYQKRLLRVPLANGTATTTSTRYVEDIVGYVFNFPIAAAL